MNPGISPNAFIGFSFLIMGIALSPSGGFSIGLPFLMMGIAFLIMAAAVKSPKSDDDQSDV